MSNVTDTVAASLTRRHRAEARFRIYGIAAIALAFIILIALLGSIATRGSTAFTQTRITLDIAFTQAEIESNNYNKLTRNALLAKFPEAAEDRRSRRDLFELVSPGATYQLRNLITDNPNLIGTTQPITLIASDDVDMFMKGYIDRNAPESDRKIKNKQIEWLDILIKENALYQTFNSDFFTSGDSREPELAGILGSMIGSLLTITVCLVVSFPLAVITAVYLEEFAPKNRFTDFIEVNINNLAAVPSIIFGLLGLAIYLNFFGLPRSAALVGGLTLALMILPTIIISTRASLQSIPGSIRDAARGLGASPLQVVLHHVLPLAMPGIMTGTILGIARALGETAPLLMIGMVAFVADVPGNFTDPSTAMPVQVYLWADSPELGFVEKTSACIMVLLAFLIAISSTAVYIRKKFEKRW